MTESESTALRSNLSDSFEAYKRALYLLANRVATERVETLNRRRARGRYSGPVPSLEVLTEQVARDHLFEAVSQMREERENV
jgi:hypothetical protein